MRDGGEATLRVKRGRLEVLKRLEMGGKRVGKECECRES